MVPLSVDKSIELEADVHLSANPQVVLAPNATYLSVSSRASFLTADGRVDPRTPPALPDLSKEELGSHMITSQLSSYPFQSAIWGLYEEGALVTALSSGDLPAGSPDILNTHFYRFLIPKLQSTYPDQPMILTLNATATPIVVLDQDTVSLSSNLDMIFSVLLPDNKTTVPAFTLASNLSTTISAGVNGTNITGHMGHADITISKKSSSFGNLGPTIISLLQGPLGILLNYVVIPNVNKMLAHGEPLPNVKVTLPGYDITVSLVNPVLGFGQGYVLVGTDADIKVTPTTA